MKKGLIGEYHFHVGQAGMAPYAGFVRGVVYGGSVRVPITLNAPRAGVSIRKSNLPSQTAEWSTDQALRNVRVIFSRDLDPAADPRAVILYVAGRRNSAQLPDLGEGVW